MWALGSAPASWFRLETNYDHWDAAGDDRRATAYKAMGAYSSGTVTPSALFNVLSTPPVLNGGTKYTTTMSAATGEFETTVRAGTAPGYMTRDVDGKILVVMDE